jgi:hypothetical protein
MLADMLSQYFEATMLVCFGFSWPLAILKTWQTKKVAGKSLPFLVLILLGYSAGIIAKLLRAHANHANPEWVTALYTMNFLLVGVDIVLYMKYREKEVNRTIG